MPTPVGPAPRDPNDPDFWDWSDPNEGRPTPKRRGRNIAAVLLALILAVFLIAELAQLR